ncbi:MAG TPA: hypothetical protein VN603_09510 [Candidatus Acidoferrales bacterium]|nr:hypothetical protein [Candidatus Acidoferrales bacterium]
MAFMAFSGPSFAQTVLTRLLSTQSNSGETGLISIVPNPAGNGIIVDVSIVGEPAGGNQPMHIHTGTCANLGGVYKPLSNVVDGHSLTNVAGMSINDLMRGPYAINVHKGPGPLVSTYVACSDISKVAVK